MFTTNGKIPEHLQENNTINFQLTWNDTNSDMSNFGYLKLKSTGTIISIQRLLAVGSFIIPASIAFDRA